MFKPLSLVEIIKGEISVVQDQLGSHKLNKRLNRIV
jgi:hypothetical protein